MKLSTKGRYGLRAMVDLAINSSQERVTLSSIAQRQDVSENYLEQVFSTLRKAGLVNSTKGAQGGYALGDHPSKIKIGTILRVLEGNLSIIDENAEGNNPQCQSVQYCIKTFVWDKINQGINDIVDSITIEDLVKEYNKINESDNMMYYI